MSSIIGFAKGLTSHPDLPDIFQYVWLEGLSEAKMAFLNDVLNWNIIDTWPAGRIFGELGEYRWQRSANRASTIHAVFILDEGKLPEVFEGRLEIEKEKENGKDRDLSMILWGEWVDPKNDAKSNPDGGPIFYAREIPKPLTYPIEFQPEKERGKTPCLIVQRYHHKSKGDFLRCIRLDIEREKREDKQ